MVYIPVQTANVINRGADLVQSSQQNLSAPAISNISVAKENQTAEDQMDRMEIANSEASMFSQMVYKCELL